MPTTEMSGLLSELDDAGIDSLLAAAGPGSPLTVVQLRHLGGAFARATEAHGPAGAVQERFQVFCLGVPVSVDAAAAIQGAFAAVRAALGDRLTGRTFFTFLGADDDPTLAFPPAALQRLQQVKRRVDPAGVIRSNRPVSRLVER